MERVSMRLVLLAGMCVHVGRKPVILTNVTSMVHSRLEASSGYRLLRESRTSLRIGRPVRSRAAGELVSRAFFAKYADEILRFPAAFLRGADWGYSLV